MYSLSEIYDYIKDPYSIKFTWGNIKRFGLFGRIKDCFNIIFHNDPYSAMVLSLYKEKCILLGEYLLEIASKYEKNQCIEYNDLSKLELIEEVYSGRNKYYNILTCIGEDEWGVTMTNVSSRNKNVKSLYNRIYRAIKVLICGSAHNYFIDLNSEQVNCLGNYLIQYGKSEDRR